jgi:hypothetical protein
MLDTLSRALLGEKADRQVIASQPEARPYAQAVRFDATRRHT